MMEDTPGPFNVRVQIRAQRFSLIGDLEEEPSVGKLLEQTCSWMKGVHSRWTIDASELRLVPEGVELWKRIVEKHLAGCQLHYLDDQLGTILQYDDLYTQAHPSHTFAEPE